MKVFKRVNSTIRLTENVLIDGFRQELVYFCWGSKSMSMARTFEVDSLVVLPKVLNNSPISLCIVIEMYECYFSLVTIKLTLVH